MMSEQQAQELMYQMQTLEGYFSQLTQKESSIISIIREASAAIESLKTIDDKTGGESLVPVGLGAFVKAKIATDEKLILNIGTHSITIFTFLRMWKIIYKLISIAYKIFLNTH